jgi:hypothetical protein
MHGKYFQKVFRFDKLRTLNIFFLLLFRQAYAADMYLWYYERTGKLEYLQRGIAALRATCKNFFFFYLKSHSRNLLLFLI